MKDPGRLIEKNSHPAASAETSIFKFGLTVYFDNTKNITETFAVN